MTRASGSTIRRFESAELDPSAVVALRSDHPALSEGRSIFHESLVGPMASPRFLVSGHNSPKLGKQVMKGPREGWPIFQLTLEERATCPTSCEQWASCYGNAMPFARRHDHRGAFLTLLRGEVATLARANPKGLLIRLHVLGDFYSVEYVLAWAEMLVLFPRLHVFGYTARKTDDPDPDSARIARAIKALTDSAWDRFAIRTSGASTARSKAIVVGEDPDLDHVIVCPAQTKASEACATCGLCWADAARDKTIAFLLHGMSRKKAPRADKVVPAVAPRPLQSLPRPAPAPSNTKAGRLATKLAAALPALFAANPDGVTASHLIAAGGCGYTEATIAAKMLERLGLGRWVYAGGQRTGKVLLPPGSARAPDLSPNQAAFLDAMHRLAVNGVFALPLHVVQREAGLSKGSAGFFVETLIARGKITMLDRATSKAPARYRVGDAPRAPQIEAPTATPTPPDPEQPGEPAVEWTDDMIERLRGHVVEGLSASATAKKFPGMSRNAVLGKAFRMGMGFGGGQAARPGAPIRRLAPAAQPRPLAKPRVASPLPAQSLDAPPAPAAYVGGFPDMDHHLPKDANPKTLMDCRPLECLWPLGPAQEPGSAQTLFCCAPVANNRHGEATSFCSSHLARTKASYQPRPINNWNPDRTPRARRAAA